MEKENDTGDGEKPKYFESEDTKPRKLKYGIPLDRIVNKEGKEDTIDIFTCQICMCLTKDALVDRSFCQVAFCSGCLNDYWTNSQAKECPLRCTNCDFQPLSRLEKHNIKGFYITCRNIDYGCQETPTYEDLDNHEKFCQFHPVKCSKYSMCHTIMPEHLISEHEKVCKYCLIKCEKCKRDVVKEDFASHDCIQHLVSLFEDKEREVHFLKGTVERMEAKVNTQEIMIDNLNQKLMDTEECLTEVQKALHIEKQEREKDIDDLKKAIKSLKHKSKKRYCQDALEEKKFFESKSSSSGSDIIRFQCEKTLVGHSDNVVKVTQMSDGRIVTASCDRSIKVWNLNTGLCEVTLAGGHSSSIYSVIELKDKRLASCSADKTVMTWNLATSKCDTVMSGHTDVVWSLLELPDGRVASGASDKSIKIWNTVKGVCDKTLFGHKSAVYGLSLLKDLRIVSGSYDNTIKIWNKATCLVDITLSGHSYAVWKVLQLKNGKLVSGSFDKSIKIWNIETQKCESTLTGHTDSIRGIVELNDTEIMTCSGDKKIKIWNYKSETCEKTYGNHTGAVWDISLLNEGKIASVSADKSIKIWQ